jgi:hypothetical protein
MQPFHSSPAKGRRIGSVVAILFCAALAGACADITVPTAPTVTGLSTRRASVCGDETEIWHDPACDPPPGVGTGTPTGGLVVNGYPDYASCFYAIVSDGDGDHVDDGCEQAIAAAFAPMLSHYTGEEDFDHNTGMIQGEYYFAVTGQTDAFFGLPGLRIAYLPAYFKDLGTGNEFIDVYLGGSGHYGDSEFIMLDVTPFDGKWIFSRAFLSAHCGSSFWGISVQANCQWWNAGTWDESSLYVGQVPHGAPWIWASDRKHAMYYSWSKCESVTAETCAGPLVFARFPVTPGFNLGSSAHPFPPFDQPTPTLRTHYTEHAGQVEDLWNGSGFHGWYAVSPYADDPTPYGRILRQFGF